MAFRVDKFMLVALLVWWMEVVFLGFEMNLVGTVRLALKWLPDCEQISYIGEASGRKSVL